MGKRNFEKSLNYIYQLVRYMDLKLNFKVKSILNHFLPHILRLTLDKISEVAITEASEDDYEYEEVIFSF